MKLVLPTMSTSWTKAFIWSPLHAGYSDDFGSRTVSYGPRAEAMAIVGDGKRAGDF